MECGRIINGAKKQHRKLLTLIESQEILQRHKIPFAKSIFIKHPDGAMAAARKIGFPVALKVVSPDISHKTEFDAVHVNLNDEKELYSAFKKAATSIKRKKPNAAISGFLVQKMASGQEILIGGKKDSQFGQTIAFGAGGIFVEVYEDVALRVVPISRKDASEMMQETKIYKILKGYRGRHYDLKRLQEILLKTSKMLEEHQEIAELDMNPIFVSATDAVAVDARIVIA